MRRGALSYSKLGALTRVATPETEDRLLDFARCATAAHVEGLVRAWCRVDRIAAAEDDRRRHESRHLEVWTDEDGMLVVRNRPWKTASASPRRRLDASRAMPRGWSSPMPATGLSSTSGARRGPFRPPSGGRSRPVTAGAALTVAPFPTYHLLPPGQEPADRFNRNDVLAYAQRNRAGVDGKYVEADRRVVGEFKPSILQIQCHYLVGNQPGIGEDRQRSQVDMDLCSAVDAGNVSRQHA